MQQTRGNGCTDKKQPIAADRPSGNGTLYQVGLLATSNYLLQKPLMDCSSTP